jgi:TrmH family RNA methyltransferase
MLLDMDFQQVGPHHPSIKHLLSVQNNIGPNPRQLVVAEGLWAGNVVLNTGTEVELFFWCPEAAYSDEAQLRAKQLAERAEKTYRISEKVLEKITERDRADGLVCVARMKRWETADLLLSPESLILVADAIEIPGNLGTLIRTLDAVKADALVLTNKRVRLTHPKVFRGSHGMSLVVPIVQFDDVAEAIKWLGAAKYQVLLADADAAVCYKDNLYTGRTAIVVGNERYGISKPWHAAGFQTLTIPMLGSADSLNVAISAAVLLYEARAQKEGW